jgi:undecaprenyl-diphosphatase
MIVYLTLALLLTAGTRWKWPAVIAAITLSAFVGLSRVMLGVHWPTDVVGGWAFGLLWVLIALPLAERLLE